MTAAPSQETPAAMIDRVASLLQSFDGRPRLTLAQISRLANLPRSSAHRILQRLVDLGWVERDGFQYGLGFDSGAVDDDIVLEQHGVTVVVDPHSAPYLQGAVVDFLSGLQESGFKIDNPNAAASCGCGHSFTVEDGESADPHAGGGCGSGCSH